MGGIRVFSSSCARVGITLETDDNEEDNTLDQIRDRHQEELDKLYMKLTKDIVSAHEAPQRQPSYKTYIEYLRENGRLVAE